MKNKLKRLIFGFMLQPNKSITGIHVKISMEFPVNPISKFTPEEPDLD